MWVPDYTFDYSTAPDTAAAGLDAVDGLTCVANTNYYIAGGRLRAHKNPAQIPPRYLAGSNAFARHRVTIVADAPVLTTGSNENLCTNIFGVDHYLPTTSPFLFYCGGFCGSTNFAILNQAGHAIPGTLIIDDDHAISAPSASYTTVFENRFSDGTTTNLRATTNGDVLDVTGLTAQPANGMAGIFISSFNQANTELQGIQSITIEHWVDSLSVGPTGTATLSGTTLSMPAPTYAAVNAGDTINYAYKQTNVYNGTPGTITGKSGSVIAPAVIPDLSWNVPSGSQNQYLGIVCEVDDGITTFVAQGYFDGVFAVGNNGVYTPAYVPAPIKPNNAAIQALFTPPATGKVIWAVIGNSISWQWTTQIPPLLNTLFGTGKVLCINGGNPGTLITDWYQGVVVGFPSQTYSQIPGYDSYNNYLGLFHAISDNYVTGDKVLISIELGTNFPAPIGSYLTDIVTLLSQLNATYASFVAGQPVPLVIHDLPTYRYNQYQSVQGTIYDPLIAEFRTQVGGNVYTGDTRLRPYFMTNRALMQSDGIHPDTNQGNDAVMRFQIAAVAPLFIPSPVVQISKVSQEVGAGKVAGIAVAAASIIVGPWQTTDREQMRIAVNARGTVAFHLNYEFSTDQGTTWYVGQQAASSAVSVDDGSNYPQEAFFHPSIGYWWRISVFNMDASNALDIAFEWRFHAY